uniref:Uncharacterized protein n=1 Tax=Brassica oleracea var. oleracea TaxID=109376 RepID=A0A0D3AX78_BRAOL
MHPPRKGNFPTKATIGQGATTFVKNTSQAVLCFIAVKPHKRCLFGRGTTQMENNYHIDPPGRRSYSSILFREGVD